MKTTKIRNQINEAIQKDKVSSQFYQQVKLFLTQTGKDNSPKVVTEVVEFVYDYLRRVPEIMIVLMKESSKAGIQEYIKPIIDITEAYFEEQNDLIPDKMGIIGFLDDAYFAMFFIQSINNSYMLQVGRPLISLDYTMPNQAVRVLLGEPIASQLELFATKSLVENQILTPMNYLIDNHCPTITFKDPIWGTTTVEERVNTQLGAWGIF